MVAKTDAVPDTAEDIIELTDIIAQGTPPPAPGTPAGPADDPLLDLKSSDAGKSPGEGDEDDLDALLAEIGATSQATPDSTSNRANPRPVNPDETLDMPDMREVENLLDGLKLPVQPPSTSADAAAAQDAGSGIPAPPTTIPAPTDDLDALLDAVAPAPPESAAPTEADDLDALLDAVAPAPPTTIPAPADDLDALLDAVAPAPPEPAAPAEADDLEAPPASAAPAPPTTKPAPAEADDPDALPDAVAPAPPASAAPPAATAKAPPPAAASSATPPGAAVGPATPKTPGISAAARASAAVTETPPLPRQWEDLLGSAPERAQVATPPEKASDAAPASQALSERMERMEKRLEQIEARLDGMERGGKEDLDRAAAAAAARILREELAAIFAEGAQ